MAQTYKIKCTNVNFDNTYNNVVRFKNKEEQQQYFNVASLFENAHKFNFDFGNELNTSKIINNYEIIDEALMVKNNPYNYLILQIDTDGNITYRYYFITNINYFAGQKQVNLDLELDVFQTFMFDLSFNPCMIERKPLKKNIKDSNFLTNEGFNPPLISKYKDNIKFKWTHHQVINEWLHENVLCWQYCFISIDGEKKYNIGSDNVPGSFFESLINETETIPAYEQLQARELGYGVIITPIYKKSLSGKIRIVGKKNDTNYSGYLDIDSYNYFWNTNNKAYIYGIKNSIKPPIEIFNILEVADYEINDNNLVIYNNNNLPKFTNLWGVKNQAVPSMSYGLIGSETSFKKVILFGNVQKINEIFESNEINLKALNIIDNLEEPKLLDICYNLKISLWGNKYDYNLLKINDIEHIQFLYNEIVTPTITKGYLRLKPIGYYNVPYANNLNGIVASTDNSITYANDKFSEFLANNKNFWMQTTLNIGVNTVQSAIANNVNTAMQVASNPTPAGAISAGVDGVMGNLNNLINTGMNIASTYFNVNNMQNAPASLSNTAGDVFFLENIENLQPYFEVEKAVDSDIKKVKDFLNAYHYGYGKIENLDITKPIFSRFNFYKCNIETFKSQFLPNIIREKLKLIFMNGVRIWENVENLFDLTIINTEVQ